MSLRTVYRWRSEGLTVDVDGARLYVRLEHVLAWKRWKSLRHPPSVWRRRNAAADGIAGAVVLPRDVERARRDWIAAGGKG